MPVDAGSGRPLADRKVSTATLGTSTIDVIAPPNADGRQVGDILTLRDRNGFAVLGLNTAGTSREWKTAGADFDGWPRYVVSKGDPLAPFTSIQDAIDAVPVDTPAVVLVHPGIYTEDIELRPNIAVVGFAPRSLLIVGTITLNVNGGNYVLANLDVQAAGTNAALEIDTITNFRLFLFECGLKSATSALTCNFMDEQSGILAYDSRFEQQGNPGPNDYTIDVDALCFGTLLLDRCLVIGTENQALTTGANTRVLRSLVDGQIRWDSDEDDREIRVYWSELLLRSARGDVAAFTSAVKAFAYLYFCAIESDSTVAVIQAAVAESIAIDHCLFPGASDSYTGVSEASVQTPSVTADPQQLEGPQFTGGPALVSFTVQPLKRTVLADSTGALAPVAVTLPSAANAIDGHTVRILNTGTGDLEVSPGAGTTINVLSPITVGSSEIVELTYNALTQIYFRTAQI